MVKDAGATEAVREALLRLYDPPALAATPLAAELVERGALRSADGLYALLLAAVDQLKPPEGAPLQSHGWRCYRYLQLRYVDCVSHESIAQRLEVSLRQATRVHQEGLQALAALLFPRAQVPLPRPTSSVGRAGEAVGTDRSIRRPLDRADSPFEAELAMVGRQPPDGAVDIGAVARSVCDTLGRIATARQTRLQIDCPAHLPPVWINRVALRQILLNLLLYLMPPATARREPGEVLLRGEQAGNLVVVTMRRAGRAGHDLAGTPSSPDDESLLTAAKHLARLQGVTVDEVDIRSSSALCLRLPVRVARTILIVDDNPEVGEMFRRMLGESWYYPVHVRTAARALSLVRESPPDVIILDVIMPSRDGWEVQATLQGDPKTASIPVVICSVLPDRDLALSLGAADFLAKPVTRPTLLRTLDRLFGASEGARPRRPVAD